MEPEITYYDNGQKESEIYYLNGKEHREDGPAVQWRYKNGKKLYEAYYLNSRYHREDGHADQWRNKNGQKKIRNILFRW